MLAKGIISNTIHIFEFAAVILELKIFILPKSGKVDLSGFAKKLLKCHPCTQFQSHERGNFYKTKCYLTNNFHSHVTPCSLWCLHTTMAPRQLLQYFERLTCSGYYYLLRVDLQVDCQENHHLNYIADPVSSYEQCEHASVSLNVLVYRHQ